MGHQTSGSGAGSCWCTWSSKQKIHGLTKLMGIIIGMGLLQKTALLGTAGILTCS